MALNYTPTRKVLKKGQISKIRSHTLNHNPVIARVKLQRIYGDKLKNAHNGDVSGLDVEKVNVYKENEVLDVQHLTQYGNPLNVEGLMFAICYSTGVNNCNAPNSRSFVCPLAGIIASGEHCTKP